jgi:hypothetical protein
MTPLVFTLISIKLDFELSVYASPASSRITTVA